MYGVGTTTSHGSDAGTSCKGSEIVLNLAFVGPILNWVGNRRAPL